MIELAPDLWLFPELSGIDDRDRATRQILASRLKCNPSDIRFTVGEAGKPFITNPETRLTFSRSHRVPGWALAIATDTKIGVDLEILSLTFDWRHIVNHLFSTVERDWLSSLDPSLQAEAFLRLWTGKEAVLKAHEIGILDGVIEPDFKDRLGSGPWPDQTDHHLATNFGHAFLHWFKYKPDFLICRATLG